MSTRIFNRNRDLLLPVPAEFDAAAAARLRRDFETAGETSAQRVIIDLSGVEFIDSSGIGAIVFLFKRLRARGRTLLLAGARGQPLQLLQMLRVFEHIPQAGELRIPAPEVQLGAPA